MSPRMQYTLKCKCDKVTVLLECFIFRQISTHKMPGQPLTVARSPNQSRHICKVNIKTVFTYFEKLVLIFQFCTDADKTENHNLLRPDIHVKGYSRERIMQLEVFWKNHENNSLEIKLLEYNSIITVFKLIC